MQGSFEKRVQEKLDELKLTPSAPVWEKIELQIKEKKKRRRGLLWIPLLALLLAGGGWWLWEQNTVGKTTTSSTQNKLTEQKQSTTADVTVSENKNERRSDNNPSVQTNSSYTFDADVHRAEPAVPPFVPHSAQSKSAGKRNQHKQQRIGVYEQKTEESIEQLLAEKISNAAIVENKATTQKKESLHTDSVPQTKPATIEKTSDPLIADTVAAKPKLALQTKKWTFSISVQAGWNKLAQTNSLSALPDAYASPNQSTGGFNSNYASPNSINGKTGYAIGVGVSREMGRRWQVSAGVQYALYRTQTKVGTFKPLDTTLRFQSRLLDVGGYYRNGTQQDYTIRTQVLEFPVSLEYKVLRSLPLYLSAGGSYGRLLQSNALTFEPTSNLYYKNKQNLERNQFAVFSSLQYSLLNKKGFQLRAGPVVQYQLTSFQKNAGTATSRLLFAGAKTSFHF